MKKQHIKNFVLVTAICISSTLSGCAANTQKPEELTANSLSPEEQAYRSGDTFTASASTAEAYESNEVISPEEQAKAEKACRDEIAEQYSIYEPYGMTYDKENNRFSYNGQIVRCFNDQLSAEDTRSFFFDGGVIDVESVRDDNGTLTGVKQSSDADFKARTEQHDKLRAEFEAAGLTGDSDCFEIGNSDELDKSLEAYAEFGVSYDQTAHTWMYDGKAIHIFYDAGYTTYYDNGVSNGVNLKVDRDKNGNNEKLVETDAQELGQYVK